MHAIRWYAVSVALFHTALGLDLGCQTVWSGPSTRNSLVDCLRGRIGTVDFWFSVSPALLLAAFAVLVLIVYIPFFVFRQCCNGCGGRNMRPGSTCYGGSEWDDQQEEAAKQYPPQRIRCFRISAILVAIGAVASTVLIVYGVIALPRLIGDIEGSVRTDVLGFLRSLVVSIESLTTDAPSEAQTTLNQTIASANTALSQVDRQFTNVVTLIDRYLLVVQVCLAVFSSLPVLTALLTLVLMCLSVRRCGPVLCTCWTFFWTVVFFLAGTVMMALLSGALFTCGEYTLAESFRPGVVNWYLIPLCSAANPLESFGTLTDRLLLDVSTTSCRAMLEICSNDTVYDPAHAQDAFTCDLTTEAISTRCSSPLMAQTILNASTVKDPGLCTATCTMATCPTACTDVSFRNATSAIVQGLSYGVKAGNLLNTLQPLVTCDTLTVRVLAPLGQCNTVRNIIAVLAVGCGWGGLMLAILIVVQFKGQKWFLSNDELAKQPDDDR